MTTRIAIVFASSGGNTFETARLVSAAMMEHGANVAMYNASTFKADVLLDADGILLGEPTWGDGDHHADFRPFDDSMADLLVPDRKLQGKGAAVFTGCDRAYRNFGRAIELMEERLIECGANILQRGLKIELRHKPISRAFTQQWGRDFLKRLRRELPVEPHIPRMTQKDVDKIMGVSEQERWNRDHGGLA
jgi:flavodoxin I